MFVDRRDDEEGAGRHAAGLRASAAVRKRGGARKAVTEGVGPDEDGAWLTRPLPHDLEVERALLGAVLLHPEALRQVSDVLTATTFYRDAHRRIYRAVQALDGDGTAVDPVTVKNELKRTGDLGAVGGPSYLATLVDGVPRSANVEHYARLLCELERRRAIVHFGHALVTRALDVGDGSADSLLDDADRAVFELRGQRESDRLYDQSALMAAFMDSLSERVMNKGQLLGVSTGLNELDAQTCGLTKGSLTYVAGLTSTGKTALAMNVAVAVAKQQGGAVLYESLEMSALELQYRLMASEIPANLWKLRKGYVSDEEYQSASGVMAASADWRLYIDDGGRLTVPQLRSRCRKLAAQPHGLSLVVIDYVQLMNGDQRYDNRVAEVASVSRGLKQVAREFNVPVLALSQLGRDVAKSKRRPELADLKESSSLEQDADNVWLLWQPDKSGLTEIILAKQRNGPLSSVAVKFDKASTRFVDAVEES